MLTPAWLSSIGQWDDDFYPTTDQDVRIFIDEIDAIGGRRGGPGHRRV